ncbi:MFS transporter, MCP family, solute carrier family 16, member 10 [Paecilomyces variotii]|uniref:MFS transporter, MCP family, solute carrier family 16, member 10 n=1 Tax=Byssochlamys spectabilis TaxID=264951 RepID=A0A443HR87_BYSSP|nr:MFS transporter, MCP family, solute carrier family 16, member 10 [Paecilomyces variotii]RWQ94325.1 MFS transporter, MCP family, solute carrier family 16, member 10 [Paecilomyces variotii]
MTPALRPIEALQTTSISHRDLAASRSSSTDKNVGTEEYIEVADRKPAIKDGGTRAWLQVTGSFLVFSNIWGFIFAFGAFESYYQITYLPAASSSSLAWIGTTANFLLIFGGILTGPLFDRGYFRTMLLTGAFLEVLAVFLLSICTKYWQVLLTQGIMLGVGNSFLYMPGLALVGRSFLKHRAAALACATCGAPIGGIVFTLVFQQLVSPLGFGSTVRVIGYIIVGCYLISFPLLLWNVQNLGDLSATRTRKLFDAKAFLELPFVIYTLSNFMVFFGYLVPFIFMSSFAQIALGMSSTDANATIMITQATSIVGRLLSGYFAVKIGNIVQWSICALASGIICIAWAGIHQQGTFFLLVALFGMFSGPLISLPPSAFVIVCSDPELLGTRLGMASAIGAFASLIGSPTAGALEQVGGKTNFLAMQLFSGVCMTTGGFCLVFLWAILIKRREGSKLI